MISELKGEDDYDQTTCVLILLTSIIMLFPIFIGLLLWNQLPDSLANSYQGINNELNGYVTPKHSLVGLRSLCYWDMQECDCNT